MSVGSKLAGLIFGLYAIASFFIVCIGVYLYFNIEVEPNFLIPLFSGILVGSFATSTLIWRTLRESLAKSLESLHTNVLFDLYTSYWGFLIDEQLFYSKEEIKKAREYLRKHGKFLGIIRLYPCKLPRGMDEFLSSHKDFTGNLKWIKVWGERKLGKPVSEIWLWYYLGFKPVDLSGASSEREQEHMELAKDLLNLDPRLVSDTKNLHESLKNMRKQIYEEIDAFLKSNNLPL